MEYNIPEITSKKYRDGQRITLRSLTNRIEDEFLFRRGYAESLAQEDINNEVEHLVSQYGVLSKLFGVSHVSKNIKLGDLEGELYKEVFATPHDYRQTGYLIGYIADVRLDDEFEGSIWGAAKKDDLFNFCLKSVEFSKDGIPKLRGIASTRGKRGRFKSHYLFRGKKITFLLPVLLPYSSKCTLRANRSKWKKVHNIWIRQE